MYPLLAFRRKVRSLDAVASGPLVVHCSAGVGRSGTYIALDTLLDEVRQHGEVDILAVVTYLRRQRMMLVQTKVSKSFHKQLPVPSICRIDQASVYLRTLQRFIYMLSLCTSISISVKNRRQSSLPGRFPTNLEFSTRQRYLC